MSLNSLNALSPLDGRYAHKVAALRPIFSESGLFRFRVFVEIRWLQWLAADPAFLELAPFSTETQQQLEAIITGFDEAAVQKIKQFEAVTNHDIKATEYYLKEVLVTIPELKDKIEWIHFACTSEDINNLAYALMLKEARKKVLLPSMQQLVEQLTVLAHRYAEQVMLARTHGQPAVPTTVGKEFANFVHRLTRQKKQFAEVELLGKCNGAVGNYNAHRVAYPQIYWPEFTHKFILSLGLTPNPYTTQIEPHDTIAEYSDALKRFNAVLIDLTADMWRYIALDYFKQQVNEQETGSSTMPHKINPIDFENAEGNLHLANSLLACFSRTLTQSRWQRDLRDSTILRNLGVALAHSLIAYQSLEAGLKKIAVHEQRLKEDLNQHWEILSEAIQTLLRKEGVPLPYERLKALSRGKTWNQATLLALAEQLDVSETIKKQICQLTPENYLGYAIELAKNS